MLATVTWRTTTPVNAKNPLSFPGETNKVLQLPKIVTPEERKTGVLSVNQILHLKDTRQNSSRDYTVRTKLR